MGMTEKIPVKREDLYEFQFLSEASLSPDGRYAAYVVTQADKEKNGYNSAIWMYDLETGKNRRMAERGGAKGILWLDEKSFLFASDRGEAPDKESAVYYRLSVDGGEAQSFLTLPHKAEKILAMGGDKYLFAARVEEYEKPETLFRDAFVRPAIFGMPFGACYFWHALRSSFPSGLPVFRYVGPNSGSMVVPANSGRIPK